MSGGLRVALLTYRGNPYSGGQGVYVRELARALAGQGHTVEVLSGPPYPDLPPEVGLVTFPSLELYRTEDPFHAARPARGLADAIEWAMISAGRYPEPLAFALRAARWLRARRDRFDVVHDNQCLAYPLLATGIPTVATIHHPVMVDRDLEIARSDDPAHRRRVKRWYGFTKMQGRVARSIGRVICPVPAVAADVSRAFDLPPSAITVVPNGADPEVFRPLPDITRQQGRIMVTTSADIPLKGLDVLVEAIAKLRAERHVDLLVVGRRWENGPGSRALEKLGASDVVRFVSEIETGEIVRLYAEAQVAVVPSRYEGFSLPAVEAMACGAPLVVTTGGALPEVAGPDGEAALVVEAGDPDTLVDAIRRLLDDADLRARLGAAARERALERFTWVRTAEHTAAVYGAAIRAG